MGSGRQPNRERGEGKAGLSAEGRKGGWAGNQEVVFSLFLFILFYFILLILFPNKLWSKNK